MPGDEFEEKGHWPVQLYIRESRRMVSDVVITGQDVLRHRITDFPVALGSYAMDSHNTQYFVNEDGFANTEGGYFHRISQPFPIDYRAIVPRKGECENLLFTICVSSTHAAYGAIRLEPCYMTHGPPAGAAASLAIDHGTSVQELGYPALRQKLTEEGIMLEDEDDDPFKVNAVDDI